MLFGAALRIQSFAFIPLWGMSNGFPRRARNYWRRAVRPREKVHQWRSRWGDGACAAVLDNPPFLLVPRGRVVAVHPPIRRSWRKGVGDFRVFFVAYLAMGVMVMGITLFQSLGRAVWRRCSHLRGRCYCSLPLVLIIAEPGRSRHPRR